MFRAVLVHKGTRYILDLFLFSISGKCVREVWTSTHSNTWKFEITHLFIFRLVYKETSHSNFQEHIDFEHMWYRYSFENILKIYLIWMTKYFQVWKWKRFFKIQTSFVKIQFQLNFQKSKHFNLTHHVYNLMKNIFAQEIFLIRVL
jgi:hypothetical protein